jgi:hypothetical protein
MEHEDDSSNLYNLLESSSNQNNVKDFKKELDSLIEPWFLSRK